MSVPVIHTLGGLLPVHQLAGAVLAPTDTPSFVVNLSWQQILTAAVYVILPLVVALVTKTTTSAATRSLVLAALSAVGGILTALLTAVTLDRPFDVTAAVGTALLGFVLAVGSHFGIWKSTVLPEVLKEIGSSQVKLAKPTPEHEAGTTTDPTAVSPTATPEGD